MYCLRRMHQHNRAYSYGNKPIRHLMCAGALGRVKPIPLNYAINRIVNTKLAIVGFEVYFLYRIYYSWHYEEINSSVD